MSDAIYKKTSFQIAKLKMLRLKNALDIDFDRNDGMAEEDNESSIVGGSNKVIEVHSSDSSDALQR